MALIKADRRLEQVTFAFDDVGDVTDVSVQVNYAVEDDTTGEQETRVRKVASVWGQLTSAQKSAANSVGKRLSQLAQQL